MTLVPPHPLRDHFEVVAVTGTDGKTTTTTLIDAMARAAGRPTLRVTTLGAFLEGERIGDPTRPTGFDRAVELAHQRGVRFVALEVTSHALADGFAKRFPPDVAVLTTFSRDHLDHHKSPEHYLASKSQLFLGLREGGTAVLPTGLEAADLVAELLGDRTDVVVQRYAVDGAPATLSARSIVLDRSGLSITLEGAAQVASLGTVRLALRSRVHAANALAAMLASEAAEIAPSCIAHALLEFRGVPGRMEVVSEAPLVLVDFAHTPNALLGTLRSARDLAAAPGARVLLVFGCGGDRDRGKRSEMGRIASELADEAIVTNDNPRSERPEAIAEAIESGAIGPGRLVRELDRKTAIARAIGAARPDDVVVIAGRGHETTQDVGGVLSPCSDLDEARAACQRLHPHAAHRS